MTHTISPSQYRNGVDTQQMYGTLDAIKDDPSLGRFQFRVSNRWIDGSTTAARSRASTARARRTAPAVRRS